MKLGLFNFAFILSAEPISPASMFFFSWFVKSSDLIQSFNFKIQQHTKWYLLQNNRFGSRWFFFFLSFQFRIFPDTLLRARTIKNWNVCAQRIVCDAIRKSSAAVPALSYRSSKPAFYVASTTHKIIFYCIFAIL